MDLFIRNVEKNVKPQDIFFIFNRLNIGRVKKVNIVPYYKKSKGRVNMCKYNHVYIKMYTWYNTEVAHNFVNRLVDGKYETRLCYKDDNWWAIELCNQDMKKVKFRKGIKYSMEDVDLTDAEVATEIDSLDDINAEDEEENEDNEDEEDMNKLLREIDFQRALWYYDEVNNSSDFNNMFIEIENQRMQIVDMIC